MDLRGNVCVFCKNYDPSADDAVVDYLTSIIQDAETDNVNLEEIEDVVTGFFPVFASLREEEKHEALWSLLQKASLANSLLCIITLDLLYRCRQCQCAVSHDTL